MTRTLFRRLLRAGFFLAVLTATFTVPLPPAVLLSVSGAFLAYDGARSRTVLAVVGLLLAAELLTGTPLGVLSLSAAAASLVLRLAVRIADWVPWARREGWPPAAFLGGVLGGWAAAAVMAVCGVALAAGPYALGFAGERMPAAFGAPWWAVPAAVAASLLILRRIDVPFRVPIRFNTR